jgi:ADP-ribosylglycohydrolase
MSVRSRYRGACLGLSAGDALGTTLEFKAPGSFTPLTDIVGGGPFSLQPGQWTDDTSMALCLAESLIERREFDPVDQLARYVTWYREGYLSSTGRFFDIGNTTRTALHRFEKTRARWCGTGDPSEAGNGSIMRLAPVPLAFARRPLDAIAMAADSSRTTHGAREAVDGCRYLAALLVGAVNGAEKASLLGDHFEPVPGIWQTAPLAARIAAVASGSFKRREPPAIRGTGYVVDSLEAALWAFHCSDSFADGACLAVNLGHDADTTGAVYGQIVGAYYGELAIPEKWRARLAHRERIEQFADRLFDLAQSLPAKE